MKRNKLKLLLLLLPLLSFGQENKFIKYSKVKVQGYPVKINSIFVVSNDSLYDAIIAAPSSGEAVWCGYSHDIRIDFLNQATKFKTDSGFCYAMYFSIEKGVSLELTADSFLLVDCAKLILSDSIGILEKYDESTKLKRWNYKDVMFIGDINNTGKDFVLALYVDKKEVAKRCKLSISDITVMVKPIQHYKKRRDH